MPALLFRRATSDDSNSNVRPSADNSMRYLLITLVVLVTFCLVLGGSLYAIRRHRKARKNSGTLPSYDAATRSFGGGGLATQTNRDSAYVFSEKQHLIDNSSPMPMSPDSVPEIRITFPEEEDREGRRISGRVVVVQVGEAGVGYVRPLEHDLPPYQTQATERFDSVDIDRIGGLKETGGRGGRT